MSFCKNKYSQGQSLFEVVLAIAVIALISVAVINASVTAIRNNSFSKSSTDANKYTEEAMEWLRRRRDDNWNSLASHANSGGRDWCLDEPLPEPGEGWVGGSGCAEDEYVTGSKYVRELTLTQETEGIILAEVTVTWTDAQGSHTINTSTRFTDWRNAI